jgi:formate hydrogenlyase transcriptional activator
MTGRPRRGHLGAAGRITCASGSLALTGVRDQLAGLVDLHCAVAGRLDRRALITSIAGAIREIVDFGRVTLLLPGTDPATLTVFAAHGRTDAKVIQGEVIPHAGSVPGWVLEHGRPMVVAKAADIRESFPFSFRRLREEAMESAAVVPLRAGGQCVGVLSLMAETEGAWQSVPPTLLEAIAVAVANAVNSCVAYEELDHLREEQAAALEVNRAVARHLRRDELFATLGQCFRGLLPFDRFGIELRVDSDRLRTHLFVPSAHASVAQVVELPAGGTACRWTEENEQWLVLSSREELRQRFPVTFAVMQREGMESLCTIPLTAEQRSLGVLFFMATARGAYLQLRRGLLDRVAGSVAVALDNCLAYEEVRNLRDRLARENRYLREEIRQEHNFEEMVGESPALREVVSQVELVAPTDSTVLVLGETGTGKELVARAIHARSRRRHRPLVKVNCSAISASLVESELFGHVKGAFTGAVSTRMGRFECADRGTIFLDEVGELTPEAQVKLLRVLQEREFEAVGSNHTRKVDVRVIAATNRDLGRAVESGSFRADLYYRLNVMPIRVPPLRERREDLPSLLNCFLRRHARVMGKHIEGVSPQTLARLTAYDWPGNIRELQNLVERAVILADRPIVEIGAEAWPVVAVSAVSARPSPHGRGLFPATVIASPVGTLQDVQRRHIETTLARCGWIIEGENGAARQLGIHPNTLRSRMKRLGVTRPRPTAS